MSRPLFPELSVLDETERACLERYLDLLVEALGPCLVEVAVFGSVARGESWPGGMPIRSDLDLLVVTDVPLAAQEVERLVDATLPLFLECGRQFGPQFRTREALTHPKDERTARFVEHLEQDAIRVYER